MQRVQKILSRRGFCSRRKAEELIKKGRVRVNKKIISIGDQAEEDDKIYVDDKLVKKQESIYLMFHKPLGCVTALTDKHYKTVMDYIDIKERVFPIGRLDKDTTGLLLLTNDGDYANKMMHPRYEVKKTYVADIDKPIREQHIQALQKGVNLEDGKTSEAEVRCISQKKIEITIHEGKNRIVRRMLESQGYEVIALKRTKVGNFILGGLKPGRYKKINVRN